MKRNSYDSLFVFCIVVYLMTLYMEWSSTQVAIIKLLEEKCEKCLAIQMWMRRKILTNAQKRKKKQWTKNEKQLQCSGGLIFHCTVYTYTVCIYILSLYSDMCAVCARCTCSALGDHALAQHFHFAFVHFPTRWNFVISSTNFSIITSHKNKRKTQNNWFSREMRKCFVTLCYTVGSVEMHTSHRISCLLMQ